MIRGIRGVYPLWYSESSHDFPFVIPAQVPLIKILQDAQAEDAEVDTYLTGTAGNVILLFRQHASTTNSSFVSFSFQLVRVREAWKRAEEPRSRTLRLRERF